MLWLLMSPLFLAVVLAAIVPVLVGIVHDNRARRGLDTSGAFLVSKPKPGPTSGAALADGYAAVLSDPTAAARQDCDAAAVAVS
jgi:hypothetical protein